MRSLFKRKLLAGVLSACMIFQTVGIMPVYALENAADSGLSIGTSSVCENHTEHTLECGYAEGTKGSPCAHEHTDDCYTEVEKCVHKHTAECYPAAHGEEATKGDAKELPQCSHICDEESGCITKELACQHIHDEECGYVEEVKESPCTHSCDLCAEDSEKDTEEVIEEELAVDVDLAIDSDVQEISKESIANVQTLIDALPTLEMLQAVTDKAEQSELYTNLQTAYDAYEALIQEEQAEVTGAEVFEALFNYFNNMTETDKDTEILISGDIVCANGIPIVIKQNGDITSVYDAYGTLLSGDTDVSEKWIAGGWQNGDHTGNTSVTVESGTLTKRIYGGNFNGNLTGDTNITINSGTVGSLFGGNENNGTVTGNTHITVNAGSVTGGVYGGGAGTNNNIITEVCGSTNIIVNGGTLDYNIYGGGGGRGATVKDANITINGGTISGNVYGGGEKLSRVTGTSCITIKDGNVGTVYGAGGGFNATQSNVANVEIKVSGGTVSYIVATRGANYPAEVTVSSTVILDNRSITVYADGMDEAGTSVPASCTTKLVMQNFGTSSAFYTIANGDAFPTGNSNSGFDAIEIKDSHVKISTPAALQNENFILTSGVFWIDASWQDIPSVTGNGGTLWVTEGLNVCIAKTAGAIPATAVSASGGTPDHAKDMVFQVPDKANALATVTSSDTNREIQILEDTTTAIQYNSIAVSVTFTKQPENASMVYGDTAPTFSVEVQPFVAGADITYQWMYGWDGESAQPISGAISSSFTLKSNNNYGEGAQPFLCKVTCNGVVNYSRTTLLTITKAPLTIVWGADKIYTGSAQLPSYTLSGLKNSDSSFNLILFYDDTDMIDAGSYTVTAKIPNGYRNTRYTLTNPTTTFKILPKPIVAVTKAEDKVYNGAGTATVSAMVGKDQGVLDGHSLTIAGLTGTFININVGQNRTVTVDGTNAVVSGTGASNYIVTYPATSANITQAEAPSVNVPANIPMVKGQERAYTFDLSTLAMPQDAGTISYAVAAPENTGLFTVNPTVDTDGKTLKFTSAVANTVGTTTTAVVTITSGNYKNATVTLSFEIIDKTPVAVSGVTVASKTYDGTAVACAGTPVAKDSKTAVTVIGYDYTWSKVDGSPLTEAPKAAGDYKLTVSVKDAEPNYTGSVDIPFSISKAMVTIKANNKSAYVGDTAPVLSASDYTISGLATGETLKIVTTIAYATTPDMSKEGSVSILVSGAEVPDGGNYNSEIIFTAGTLTISQKSSGGGGGNGGGTTGSSDTPSVVAPDPAKPTAPTTTTTDVKPTVDKNGNASISITNKTVDAAIKKAQDEGKKNGTTQNGIAVEINATTNKAVNNIAVTLPKSVQDKLIVAGVKTITIKSGAMDISINLEALKQIHDTASSDVNITSTKVDTSKLSTEAQKAIGNRPVFDFKVTGTNGKTVQSFGKGSVSIAMPYTLAKGEKAGNVVTVYINDAGKVEYITDSSYNVNTGKLLFATDHCFTYGVAYQADTTAANFSDITNHWAKESIEFVAARGLFAGTSDGKFSPNASMTRGMFATALGRLAGADVSSYQASSFTDVKAGAYYLGYVEWANKNGIVKGTGTTIFAPDSAITREQMATIIANYAKAIGFELPTVYSAATFEDNASISSFAAASVKQMQMAGVLMGKDGNKFDPQCTATRAEVSVMMKRFVELIEKN